MIGNVPLSSKSSPENRPGRLIVIAGPGGVGKSTIVAELRRRIPLHFSVSATTRDPRPAEVQGFHYRFVTRPEFRRLIDAGDLLEWAEFNGNYYGTPRDAVVAGLEDGRDVLLEIEVQGAAQIRQAMPEATMIFLAPPSTEALRRRLLDRADTSEADIEAKLRIAQAELAAAPELFDHIVVNDDRERAVGEILGILATG
ncbi:MAG TPA: guanylate kinase [Acidimicrobiia bacterium]|nr:guanylate kinase [Acidimicrobiia bacterium]